MPKVNARIMKPEPIRSVLCKVGGCTISVPISSLTKDEFSKYMSDMVIETMDLYSKNTEKKAPQKNAGVDFSSSPALCFDLEEHPPIVEASHLHEKCIINNFSYKYQKGLAVAYLCMILCKGCPFYVSLFLCDLEVYDKLPARTVRSLKEKGYLKEFEHNSKHDRFFQLTEAGRKEAEKVIRAGYARWLAEN